MSSAVERPKGTQVKNVPGTWRTEAPGSLSLSSFRDITEVGRPLRLKVQRAGVAPGRGLGSGRDPRLPPAWLHARVCMLSGRSGLLLTADVRLHPAAGSQEQVQLLFTSSGGTWDPACVQRRAASQPPPAGHLGSIAARALQDEEAVPGAESLAKTMAGVYRVLLTHQALCFHLPNSPRRWACEGKTHRPRGHWLDRPSQPWTPGTDSRLGRSP